MIAIKPALLDKEQAATYCCISETTLEKGVREGNFPPPRQLVGRRVGWLVEELDVWARTRPVSTLLPPPNTGAKKPRATSSNAPGALQGA
ncbi:helix-turn-helix transcriptional regulator [Hylemonella gracilis]|uniref:helix-turn-helix transcriptional regulator n=1 Tax=Hylemonella gracilis TaxID=80880 RepID=UPI000558DDDA|nr:AlpA family phage regulatory protein [Hylemonella gracilis]